VNHNRIVRRHFYFLHCFLINKLLSGTGLKMHFMPLPGDGLWLNVNMYQCRR